MDNLNPVSKTFYNYHFPISFLKGFGGKTQYREHHASIFAFQIFFNDLRETDRTCHRLPLIFLTKKMALSKTFLNTFFFQNYLHIVMIYFRENKFETVSFALVYGLWSFHFNNFAIAIYEFPKIIVRSRKIIAEFPNSE